MRRALTLLGAAAGLAAAVLGAFVAVDARLAARAADFPISWRRFEVRGGRVVSVNPTMPRQSFAVEKAPDEFRVFVLGGSQAMGVPYVSVDPLTAALSERLGVWNEGGLSTWLQAYLSAALPGRRVVVINAAMAGQDTAASVRTLDELLGLGARPDLVVLLSGDNEREGISRINDMLLDPGRGVDAEVARLAAGYRRTLRLLVRRAEAAKVRTYVLTVADNIRDWAPAGPEALRLFRAAKDLDARGRFDEARRSYLAAKDLDRRFVRCRSSWNDVIRGEARGRFVGVIDWERLLAARAKDGIPGLDLFYDYCHMKLPANKYAAYVVARRLLSDEKLAADPGRALASASLPSIPSGQLRAMSFFKWALWSRAWLAARLRGRPDAETERAIAHQYALAMLALDADRRAP